MEYAQYIWGTGNTPAHHTVARSSLPLQQASKRQPQLISQLYLVISQYILRYAELGISQIRGARYISDTRSLVISQLYLSYISVFYGARL